MLAAAGRRLEVTGEMHLVITGDDQVAALNAAWRDKASPTDVLSFPDGDVLPDGTRLLGEVVISLDTARRQAEELGHSELRELQELGGVASVAPSKRTRYSPGLTEAILVGCRKVLTDTCT